MVTARIKTPFLLINIRNPLHLNQGTHIITLSDAGWSSLVARRAHNPKVVGSNPAPATKFKTPFMGFFIMSKI